MFYIFVQVNFWNLFIFIYFASTIKGYGLLQARQYVDGAINKITFTIRSVMGAWCSESTVPLHRIVSTLSSPRYLAMDLNNADLAGESSVEANTMLSLSRMDR